MISLLKHHWHLVGFGFLFTFGSAFGQTFFIGEFTVELKQAFGLSDGGLGWLYFIGTTASSVALLYTGRLIDRWPLHHYAMVVHLGLFAGCLLIAFAWHWLVLIPAFFLLRQCGQGLSTHIFSTTMGRYFDKRRGQALGMGGVGISLAEVCFPWMLIPLLMLISWRSTWLMCAVIVLVLIGLTQLCLRLSPRVQTGNTKGADAETAPDGPSLTQAQAIRGLFFYGLFSIAMAPGFIITGVFFFRKPLGLTKDWSVEIIAGGVSIYAISAVVFMLISGAMIDRFGAIRLLWLPFPFLGAGMAVLSFGDLPLSFLLGMTLIGTCQGLIAPVLGAAWPEAYGPKHLGAIRSISAGIMIFATAASPLIWGGLLDLGASFDQLFLWSIVWVALTLVVAVLLPKVRPCLSKPVLQ